MTSDEVLKAALAKTADEYFSQYDVKENEKPHRFSLAYRIRKHSVKKLAAKSEGAALESLPRKNYVPLKRLFIITVSVIMAAVLAAAAGAVYLIGVRGFNFNVHEQYSDVSVDFSMYDIKETIEEIYRLPVDSGYELVYDVPSDVNWLSEYDNGKNRISLGQFTKSFAENFMANTENSELYEVTVDGEAGFLLLHHRSDGEDGAMLTWVHNGYLFEMAGDTDVNIVTLAELLSAEE